MFKVGDTVIPTINNAEYHFEKPIPRYKIIDIGMGRIFAENTRTKEVVDLAGDGDPEYYYEKAKSRKRRK